MKYKVLFKILKGLVFIKQIVWAIGSQIFVFFSIFGLFIWKNVGYVIYKIRSFCKKQGLRIGSLWFLRRDNLQIILFLSFFVICLPQTALYNKENIFLPGQNTLAYKLFGPEDQEKIIFEELYPETSVTEESQDPSWRIGMIHKQQGGISMFSQENVFFENQQIYSNKNALIKPIILPWSKSSASNSKDIINYVVQEGDSLGGIAYRFNININTLLWENNLTLRSIIKPGQIIRILPIDGVSHIIKKGDTLKKIANAYKGKVEEIAFFNGLEEDGSNLKVGEKIIVPNGIKQITQSTIKYSTNAGTNFVGAIPPSSNQTPSVKGFVWPSAAKNITQYFSWRHHGLDIAGPKNSANYAAKDGIVEVSQCGWNSGYGCYIIINHGGGIKTLYGHNNSLLVKVGDQVVAGQTIGLMGNTGKVYGLTGIHLHFEVIVNGIKKNPLLYIR